MNATSRSHSVAAWCGLALYPLAVALATVGSSRTTPAVRALGVTLSAVLLVGVARRIPFLGLVVVLLAPPVAAAAQQSGRPFGEDGRAVTLLAFLAADIVLGRLVAVRGRRQWISGIVLSVIVQALAIGFFVAPENMIGAGVVAVLALLVACMVGLLAGERRAHADALRTQAVSEAVTAERLRIARELHDMVSHSIGVIAIQSGVAARVVETRPREAREALSAIEDTSRETLAGLRRTLVALRTTDPDGAAPLVPAAGLGDLDALAAATGRDAGVRVDLVRAGTGRTLPPDIELAAYRIVQESLTNVVKHAGVDVCRVAVRQSDDALVLEITDAGTGGSATVPGMGITGMRERVSLLHGEFGAGPGPEGGFRVTARIPLPGADR
ncbi:sensor histidine kinase [Streptomyces sp. NPDC057694]|uniref:sensor histidine kinase n=1 Tax=Streptomyces sp. NPDC057694 TaxID=3346216 RepID=UPI0036936D09